MGEGLVDKLQKEPDLTLDVTWLPFELHPETPAEGVSLADYFGTSPEAMQQMFQRLKARAAAIGLPMAPPPTLINTHQALLLAEYAREMGRVMEVHGLLFRAYFVEGRNLADPTVLREIAKDAAMDPDTAMNALQHPKYEERIRQSMADARDYGVTGVPTFVIAERHKIVGVQPYDELLSAFRKIQQRPS